MEKILIVDDDPNIGMLLKKFLTKKNYQSEAVMSGSEALIKAQEQEFDLILCDYKLPDYEGIEILQKLKALNPRTEIIIITGYSDVRTAVQTLKEGAADYVTKPLYPDEILKTIREVLSKKKEQSKSQTIAKKPEISLGKSRNAREIINYIEVIAPTDMSVVILGETGTGKEYVANAIHKHSHRAQKPFVAVDCGALPDNLAGSVLFGHVKGAFTGAIADKVGSFEAANGGTLFLDEIGNLSFENQVKLLRVLQERKIKRIGGIADIEIDVRIITATNENLKLSIQDNTFREDIYHRINEFTIEIEPLRKRKEDIEYFAHMFLKQANVQLNKNVVGFSEDVMQKFKYYKWNGNLRELSNVIKRCVLLSPGNMVELNAIPEEISSGDSDISQNGNNDLRSASDSAEKNAIMAALEQTGFNKSQTAKLLKIDRKTLYNKLKYYQISY